MNQKAQQTRGSIWKYDLEHDGVLEMPAGAKVLSVGWDKVRILPVLYVLVDPEVPKLKRRVKLLSTGNELIGDGWDFAGTVHGPLSTVHHVFLEIV